MGNNQRPTYYDFLTTFEHCLSEKDFTANEQLLYYTLLSINNSYRWSEYFSKTDAFLIDRTKIGRTALHTARNSLKQRGLIDFIPSKKRGTSTQYRICDTFCRSIQYTQTDTQTVTQTDIQTNIKPSRKSAANKDKRNKTEDINIIPPKSPKGEIAAMIENYTDNNELQKALYDFAAMRRSIKKPITVRGLELALKQLDTLAANDRDRLAVVNQSVMNSWQGLFPLKNAERAGNRANTFLRYSADSEKPNYNELEELMHRKFD